MRNIVVSGRMAVLFDSTRLEVAPGASHDEAVTGYTCRWCGWTYVVDDPRQIPDHACDGPLVEERIRVREFREGGA